MDIHLLIDICVFVQHNVILIILINFIIWKNYTINIISWHREVDSDGDELTDDESMTGRHGYRVWYALEVNVTPLPQQSLLQLTCACQVKVT